MEALSHPFTIALLAILSGYLGWIGAATWNNSKSIATQNETLKAIKELLEITREEQQMLRSEVRDIEIECASRKKN